MNRTGPSTLNHSRSYNGDNDYHMQGTPLRQPLNDDLSLVLYI